MHWVNSELLLDKFAYNKRHPYTSIIPIVIYVVVRNLWPRFRAQYCWLWAVIGKISLESYIGQIHVRLGSDAKSVINLLPGYPLLNFLVASGIFVSIANLLFQVTQLMNDAIFPPNEQSNRTYLRNARVLVSSVAVIGYAEHLQNLARGYLGD